MRFRNLRNVLSRFSQRNGDIHIPERLEAETKVTLNLRHPGTGKIEEQRESSNIVVNGGRQWIRDLVSATTYPEAVPPGPDTALVVSPPPAPGSSVRDASGYRPRFIGFGVGGTLQGVTPPGPRTFTEVVTRTGLELPVLVIAGFYARQILGQTVGDVAYTPDNYTINFRQNFVETDISFAAQPTYGTSVPLSEIGLLHSGANPEVTTSESLGPPTGFIAYNTFATITKTPLFQLEVIWQWRF
jgi:hypothetical protein